MKVLVVEDEVTVRTLVTKALRSQGFAVDIALDGEQALTLARSKEYDVILLDLRLPVIDGLTVLQRLREEQNVAKVLVLTGRDTIEERVAGLNAGADDYLGKPFARSELLARVGVLVRRQYSAREPVLQVADLSIDVVARTAHRAGRAIELTALEFALLEFLALRAGQIVSRDDIWDHVYEYVTEPVSNVTDVYIGYLRRKLEADGGSRLIHTRRGMGYVLSETA